MDKMSSFQLNSEDYRAHLKKLHSTWWHRLISRFLLHIHPVVNRDKALERLDDYLRERALNRFFARLSIALEKQEEPLLSVVVTCYNYGRYLKAAVDSVRAQTFQNFEIIIVDDGSTDEQTLKVLKELDQDPEIKVVHQENQGVAAARNTGIKISRGEYICPMDADDLFHSAYFEKGLKLLEHYPEFGLVYSWVKFFGEKASVWQTRDFKLEKLAYNNQVPQSPIFAKEAWAKAGGYKVEMKGGYEDWEFVLSLAEKGYRGKAIPEPLFYYRRHADSMVEKSDRKKAELVGQIRAFHPDLYPGEELVQDCCPWCGSGKLEAKFCRADLKVVLECLQCGLGFVDRVPQEPDSLYQEDYFKKQAFDAEKPPDNGFQDYETNQALEVEFNKYLNLLRMFPAPGKSLLDVGCATGRFLEKAKEEGYQVRGVEISPYGAEIARQKGFDIFTGDLTEAKFPDNSFDIITLFETVEHIFDLKTLFLEVKRILKPDGLVVITTPDAFSYGAKVGKDKWVGAGTSLDHVHYLGRKALASIFRDTGGFSPLLLATAGPEEIQLYDQGVAIARKTKAAEIKKTGKKVLFVINQDTLFVHGGATVQLLKTINSLEKLGLDIQVDTTLKPDPSGFDLVCILGCYKPESCLPQVKWLKECRVPVLATPIYMDFSEFLYIKDILAKRIKTKGNFFSPDRWKIGFKRKPRKEIQIPPPEKRNEPYPGYDLAQKEFFEHCDYLLPNSQFEMEKIRKNFGVKTSFTVIPNAVEGKIFLKAPPEFFRKKYQLSDFVLCVGSIEFRKNQLLVSEALKDTDLTLVLIGPVGDRECYNFLKARLNDRLILLPHHGVDFVASAYQNAWVHILASWVECAPVVNLEAALADCSLVVSDRSSEKEYFGEFAYYCDPGDTASIRKAVLKAWNNYDNDKIKREKLKEKILKDYNWEQAAQKTLAVYEKFF